MAPSSNIWNYRPVRVIAKIWQALAAQPKDVDTEMATPNWTDFIQHRAKDGSSTVRMEARESLQSLEEVVNLQPQLKSRGGDGCAPHLPPRFDVSQTRVMTDAETTEQMGSTAAAM